MSDKKLKAKIYEFLKRNKHAVLSTMSFDNKPESSSIYFGVDHDLNFYFFVGDSTRKHVNLKERHFASIVITDEYTEQTVQAEGIASEVTDIKKESVAIKAISEAITPSVWGIVSHIFDPIPPILKMNNGMISFYKLKTEWLRWADFKNPVDKDSHEYFELAIP